jgi:hypothetical protein
MNDLEPYYTQDELDELQAQLERAKQQLADLKLATAAVTEGIWLLHLMYGDAAHKDNSMRWSKQYRSC